MKSLFLAIALVARLSDVYTTLPLLCIDRIIESLCYDIREADSYGFIKIPFPS
jgi:hypothetical protein